MESNLINAYERSQAEERGSGARQLGSGLRPHYLARGRGWTRVAAAGGSAPSSPASDAGAIKVEQSTESRSQYRVPPTEGEAKSN